MTRPLAYNLEMEDLWKEAFPVGTEWDQYPSVYNIDWNFSHLEEAFEEGGELHNRRVYLFGCTEPQLVHMKDKDKVIHIPAVVAVVSDFPPSEELGVKSVQMEEEQRVSLKAMKMGWVPYIPHDVAERTAVERLKTQIFTLKCNQRRAALRQLDQERLKKFEYLLPYFDNPLKKLEFSSSISAIYPFEGDRADAPPLVVDFDWKEDDLDEFAESLVEEESLPAGEVEKFKAFVTAKVEAAKGEIKEAAAKRRKAVEELSEKQKKVFEEMKFYKFYPSPSEDTPDVSQFKSKFINRYYGKAHKVFPEDREEAPRPTNLWAAFQPSVPSEPEKPQQTPAATANGNGSIVQ